MELVKSQLAKDFGQVAFGSVLRYAQLPGDLAVGAAYSHQLQHLQLPRSEVRMG